jgi:S-adenosylmethionine decarboxylase
MDSVSIPSPDYQPGLHCLAEAETSGDILTDFTRLRNLWNELIAELGLTKVGEVYHSFDGGGGYTAFVCLTESHLSIHTWPEYNRLNLDIFLSNFKRDNNAKTEEILRRTLDLFQPSSVKTQRLER